jgi:hypothetical protein
MPFAVVRCFHGCDLLGRAPRVLTRVEQFSHRSQKLPHLAAFHNCCLGVASVSRGAAASTAMQPADGTISHRRLTARLLADPAASPAAWVRLQPMGHRVNQFSIALPGASYPALHVLPSLENRRSFPCASIRSGV